MNMFTRRYECARLECLHATQRSNFEPPVKFNQGGGSTDVKAIWADVLRSERSKL